MREEDAGAHPEALGLTALWKPLQSDPISCLGAAVIVEKNHREETTLDFRPKGM